MEEQVVASPVAKANKCSVVLALTATQPPSELITKRVPFNTFLKAGLKRIFARKGLLISKGQLECEMKLDVMHTFIKWSVVDGKYPMMAPRVHGGIYKRLNQHEAE